MGVRNSPSGIFFLGTGRDRWKISLPFPPSISSKETVQNRVARKCKEGNRNQTDGKQATQESLDWVRERYGQGDLRIKRASMAVFKRVGGWSVLPDLIDSLSDENVEVRRLGWQLLIKWRIDAARLFVHPNIRDLECARQSLERVAPRYKIELSNSQEELLKQIAFFIR